VRKFETGATRDDNSNKPDHSGFMSPRAIKMFGAYMQKHQRQADGQLRSSSNWKLGMPIECYKESLIRHVVDFWDEYEQGKWSEADELACAIFFNVQGYLHERARQLAMAPEIENDGDTTESTLDTINGELWGRDVSDIGPLPVRGCTCTGCFKARKQSDPSLATARG
jgi:hypothetical protein